MVWGWRVRSVEEQKKEQEERRKKDAEGVIRARKVEDLEKFNKVFTNAGLAAPKDPLVLAAAITVGRNRLGEILRFAAQKKPGEELTAEDIFAAKAALIEKDKERGKKDFELDSGWR